jgi:D-alanine-D-alanine ligase
MKIAVVYNRESQDVINLFGVPNREKYGTKTIKAVVQALKSGGHQVQSFEGDKHVMQRLEQFMPAVLSGERPGLVFNLSYGIQGRARYTHVPGILEMLGIPYVGSPPDTHALALDKVVTKMILRQRGLPTPAFDVLDTPDAPLSEELSFPLIVKPKNEAVSFGLRVVHDEAELRDGAKNIFEHFQQPVLVEQYIEGREVNVGLLGNDPPQALPPVELVFGEGPAVYTYEDKTHRSGREIQLACPAPLSEELTERVQGLAIRAFSVLGCQDCARVDFRLDHDDNPYILEINSMASLGQGGSYVRAAREMDLDYDKLANRLVEVAAERVYGTPFADQVEQQRSAKERGIFNHVTGHRDALENDLQQWTDLSSRTEDAVRLGSVVRKLDERLVKLGLEPVPELSAGHSAWTWQTPAGLKQGSLLVLALDSPITRAEYPIRFRREPEWLAGEAIATSRAGIACTLAALGALRSVRMLKGRKIGLLAYSDEGRGMRYSAEVLRQAAGYAREVLVLRPGQREGGVTVQRRGLRKYSLLVEGDSLRVGAKTNGGNALEWMIRTAPRIAALSEPSKRFTVSLQDLRSDRYSILLPHRVRATLCISFIDKRHADGAEEQLEALTVPGVKGLQVRMERLERRPPMQRQSDENPILGRLRALSEAWKLPFGVHTSLLPSAAGEVPRETPVLCGLAPAGRELYTPQEAVHRGELVQRALLLALHLGGFEP